MFLFLIFIVVVVVATAVVDFLLHRSLRFLFSASC